MQDLRRVANWILVGLLFQVLDFTIDGFDIIPDVLGALFIAIGAFMLVGSRSEGRAERAAGFMPMLAVLAVVGTIAEMVAPEAVPWYLLTTLLFVAIADVFAERCASLGFPELARRWEFNRNLTLVLEVFVATIAGWALAVAVAEVFAILVLAGLWPFIHRVVLLFAVRRVAAAPVPAQPTPEMPQA